MVFAQLLPWREAGTEREFRSHCVHRQPPPFPGPRGLTGQTRTKGEDQEQNFLSFTDGGSVCDLRENTFSLSRSYLSSL